MKELHLLEVAATKPLLLRLPIYLRLSGPGWLQGAMTLGGGSAVTSLMIGAVYGYELLWLQPLAMLIGCIMLFALSHFQYKNHTFTIFCQFVLCKTQFMIEKCLH